MNKQDLLDIIRVAKAIEVVNNRIELLTGSSICQKLDDLNRLIDIIRRNANNKYKYADDSQVDNSRYVMLMDLLQDPKLSAEDIYKKIVK